MEFRDKVFLCVAEELNFSNAAKKLFISQPAVSKHIKELELTYQTKLLERSHQKVALTPQGQILQKELLKIDASYQSIQQEINLSKGIVSGYLKIGASTSIAQYWLAEPLANFIKDYPQIEIEIIQKNSREIEKLVQTRAIDVGLVENKSSFRDLKYTTWKKDKIVAIANAELPKIQTIKDLQNGTLILREEGSGLRNFIEEDLNNSQLIQRFNRVIELQSNEAILTFISYFPSVGIVPEIAFDNHKDKSRLTLLNLPNLRANRTLRMVENPVRENQLVTKLINNFKL